MQLDCVFLYRRYSPEFQILHTTAIGSPPIGLCQWPAEVDIIICILINMYELFARGQSVFTVGMPSSINTNSNRAYEICICFPFKEQGMLMYCGLKHGEFW